jgi:hypothetical protein
MATLVVQAACASITTPPISCKYGGQEETVRSLRRRVAQVIETMDPAVAPQPRPTDVIIAMVLEAAAQEAEAFSWVLPMYNRPDLDQATDDAACAVQEQIAAALRARARAYIERP